MPKINLTAAAVERLKPPSAGRIEYFDQREPGLALRVTDKNAKSWVVFYRVNGRLCRYTIGRYPAFSLKDAREEAQEAKRLAKKGTNVAAEKIEARRRISEKGVPEAHWTTPPRVWLEGRMPRALSLTTWV